MRRLLITACLPALIAGPALAQDPSEDWDLTTSQAQQLTLATLDFGENVLALRCQAGALDLLLTGVPISVGALRKTQVTIGAVVAEEQVWAALPGQPVIGADEPARLARQLRAGGELDVRLEPEDAADRSRRYRLTAPRSTAVVDTVLTACGAPLDEPRDQLVRIPVDQLPVWLIQPAPEFPAAALTAGVTGAVVRLSCVVSPEWGLADCRADADSAPGNGFGANAVRAAERARIAPPADGTDVRGRLLRFTIRYAAPA